MTKTKKIVAALAALAVGTTMAASVTLVSGNVRFPVYAASSEDDASVGTVGVGASKELSKGTYTLDISNLGTYVFSLDAGSASFAFSGIYENQSTDTVYTYGLNANTTSFYITVTKINSPTVEIVTDDTVSFTVAQYIGTGTNEISLEEGKEVVLGLYNPLIGTYTVELASGGAAVAFGSADAVVLSSSNDSCSFDVSSYDPLDVTLTYTDSQTVTLIVSYSINATALVVGDNTLSLSTTPTYALIYNSVSEDGNVRASEGYYTFTRISGTTYIVIDNQTYGLSISNKSFTVYLSSPSSNLIALTSNIATATTVSFSISYSESDPDATSNALAVGTQTVNATGGGEEYTFTSENGGSYTLTCTDSNAYIMLQTTYVDEEYGEITDWEWIDAEASYTFTLTAGESIVFVMSTNDWSDATYDVTISEVNS